MRYIELNPVRAQGMVDHPSEYPWSSYRCNALGETDRLVMPHQEYKHLGTTNKQRESAYRQLFHSHISDMTLEAIREATNKAWVLGSESFKHRMEKELNRPAVSCGQGGDRKSKAYRQRNHRV